MNREIKFRAWNKDNDEMVYSFDYPYHWNIGDLGLELLESDGTDYVRQEAVFMQFTGLLDKNGAEIYEGDIISDERFTNLKDSVEYKNGEWILWDYPDLNLIGCLKTRECEIIGNIYENPELL